MNGRIELFSFAVVEFDNAVHNAVKINIFGRLFMDTNLLIYSSSRDR